MKVAIAGFGQEGKASYAYWNTSENEVTIVDERDSIDGLPENVPTILGIDSFAQLSKFDLVIRSPGINPKKLPYGEKVWSATNEFFEKCPAPTIGVTGTKGKGTTSSLIVSILQKAGKTVHLVGNIGVPALEELPNIQTNSIVVFELSSFQLWDIKKSPQTAVVLGIEADHLDVHADLNEYIEAKANITKYQTESDTIVYKRTNNIANGIGTRSIAVKIAYPSDEAVHVTEGWFYHQMVKICSVDAMQIPGAHNIENACAAIAAAWNYTQDSEAIEAGLRSFTGLPHRIKFVRELGGVSFYDDSYSSAPAATIAAINSFSTPEIIIIGGYDKGADFSELAKHIARSEQIKKVLIIGQTRLRIMESLRAVGVDENIVEMHGTTDFSTIIKHAHEIAEPGDVIVLSPACASFDMFKNFTDRGEQFAKIVEALS